MNDVLSDMDHWMQVNKNLINFTRLQQPLQSTIKGIRYRDDEELPYNGTMNDLLSVYYRRRHDVEKDMKWIRREYFENGALIEARLSYSPIRMMGWWTKQISDEIDWLLANGGDAEDPYARSSQRYTATRTPPAFTDRMLTPSGVQSICQDAVVLQGRPSSDAPIMERRIWSKMRAAERDTGSKFTPLARHDHLRTILIDELTSHTTVGEVVGIDLETTGLHATRDWVIDAGWLKTDLHDPTNRQYDQRRRSYGVSDTRYELGNPTVNISGIETSDLVGLKPLDADPSAQDEIYSALTSGIPFVAHSAGFEDAFFCQNIDGYAEAKRDGLVKIIDSRKISQWLDDYDGKMGNHLEQYARHWDALDPQYGKERHLGLEDSEIMLRALSRHLQTITPQQ